MYRPKIVGMMALSMFALTPSAFASNDLIMGWIEEIALKPWNLVAKAKLDTGADTASLHGKDITRFVQNGNEWIRFILEVEDEEGLLQQYEIERQVTRNVRIKRHGNKYQLRPVIDMEFCMGSQVYKTEFSVTDRAHFNYPVLLGRNFLNGLGMVDSSSTYQTQLHCGEPLKAPNTESPAGPPETAKTENGKAAVI